MWGPYARAWSRVRDATSRRFRRGVIRVPSNETKHDVHLRPAFITDRAEKPPLFDGYRTGLAVIAGVVLVVGAAIFLGDPLVAPFLIVGLLALTASQVRLRWKVPLVLLYVWWLYWVYGPAA